MSSMAAMVVAMASAKMPVAVVTVVTVVAVAAAHEMTMSIPQMNMPAHDWLPVDVAKVAKI